MAGTKRTRGGGGAATPIPKKKGGSLGPALKMAGTVAAASSMSSSFMNVSYIFMIIIMVLIVWILYLIQDNLRKPAQAKSPSFSPVASTSLFTEPGSVVSSTAGSSASPVASIPLITSLAAPGTRHDPFEDPYEPPLKQDGMYFPTDSSDVRGVPLLGPITAFLNQPANPATCNSGMCDIGAVNAAASQKGWPINMKSRGFAPEFSQIGILTYDRVNGASDNSLHDNMILPLFGRRVMNGRDKYQYYTMSNTGSVNTKLPVMVRNRDCIGEYGCDEISNGDTVYVQGYNRQFKATVYQNSLFAYIPFI